MSTDHKFRKERRAETDSNRSPSAYQPNALPLGQNDSHAENRKCMVDKCRYSLVIPSNALRKTKVTDIVQKEDAGVQKEDVSVQKEDVRVQKEDVRVQKEDVSVQKEDES